MNPAEVALLEASLEDVRAAGPRAAEAFYAELFRLEPAAPELFHLPVEQQAAVFLSELDALLAAVRDLPAFVARARQLGRRHAGRGVRAHHFDAGAAALPAMLRAVYGEPARAEVAGAWRHAYRLAAQVMQEELFALE